MSTCDTLKQQIAQLTNEIKSLQEDLTDVAGDQKWAILQQIKKLQDQLTSVKNEFKSKCITKQPPVPLKPVTIGVSEIFCVEESSEWGSDEPYLLVLTLDMTATISIQGQQIPFPALTVFRIGPWDDVDSNEAHPSSELAKNDRKRVWDLHDNLKLINSPNDIIILVAMMEHDDSDPDGIRVAVQGIMSGVLFSSLSFTRPQLIKALTQGMNNAIQGVRASGATFPFNFDDQIDTVRQLQISPVDLQQAAQQGSVLLPSLIFGDGDAKYQVTFMMNTTLP